MDLFINDIKQDLPDLAGHSLGEVLSAVTTNLNDLVLVSLRLDGRELDQQALDEAAVLPMEQAGRVELVMQSRGEMAAEALHQTADMLAGDRRCYAELAASLSVSGLDTGAERLNDCLNNWVMAQQAITQAVSAVGLELAALPEDYRVTQRTQDLTATLSELQQRLHARDSVAIADLLEYDLAAVARDWIDLCDNLAAAASER